MTSMLINLISRCTTVSYTHNYIMGFTYKGAVYKYETTGLGAGIKLDAVSSKNGGGYSLRYYPAKAEKQALIESGICKLVCSKEYFEELVKNSKYNRGEIFEKLVTESYGQTWEKDNVRFDKGADLTTPEKAYSIKFEKATICTERTLSKIESLR